MEKFKIAVLGLVTGFANGLFGSGGGTLVVPGMQKFLKVEQHKAHATAIAIILPLTVYIFQGCGSGLGHDSMDFGRGCCRRFYWG